MNFHVKGDTITATGGVVQTDDEKLARLLALTRENGKQINTLVLRNVPGGYADVIPAVQKIVRDNGFRTVVHGFCYSACASIFVSGTERQFSEYTPLLDSFFDETLLAIHGPSEVTSTSSLVVAPPEDQQSSIDGILDYLGEVSEDTVARIYQAHYDLQETYGYLEYFDARTTAVPTRFCPTQVIGSDCTFYPNVTALDDRIITTNDYAPITDRLILLGQAIEGNINPNFSKETFKDTWGSITLRDRASWQLSEYSGAYIVWIDKNSLLTLNPGSRLFANLFIYASHESHIKLNGGTISGTYVVIRNKGHLSGSGKIENNLIIGYQGTFAPQNIVLSPVTIEDSLGPLASVIRPTVFQLRDEARLLIAINGNTNQPAVTLTTAEGFERANIFSIPKKYLYTVQFSAEENSVFELNARPDYYAANKIIPVIGHLFDPTPAISPYGENCNDDSEECQASRADPVDQSSQPIGDKLQLAATADNPDELINLEESNQLISARKDSLLQFELVQTDDAISLLALPVFENNSPFSGDFGNVLQQADRAGGGGIAPLLGTLQFASRSVAQAQTSALRGDINAATVQASSALANHFGTLITQHQDDARLHGGSRSRYNTGSFSHTDLASVGHDTAAARLGGAAYTVAANTTANVGSTEKTFDQNLTLSIQADNPLSIWGRAGGSQGHIKGGQNDYSSRLNTSAFVLGVDRVFADQNRTLGLTLGFGSTRLNEALAGSRRINAVDLGLYVDQGHPLGYVTATARYTRFHTNGTRAIQNIAGLESPYRASYNSQAFSLSLENSLKLPSTGNVSLEALLPLVEYQHTGAVRFSESGDGPAALSSRARAINSLRLGIGGRVSASLTDSAGKGVIVPYLTLRLYRNMLDSTPVVTNAFVSAPDAEFGIPAAKAGRFGAVWNTGVNFKVSDQTAVAVDYNGNYTRNYLEHGLSATVKYAF